MFRKDLSTWTDLDMSGLGHDSNFFANLIRFGSRSFLFASRWPNPASFCSDKARIHENNTQTHCDILTSNQTFARKNKTRAGNKYSECPFVGPLYCLRPCGRLAQTLMQFALRRRVRARHGSSFLSHMVRWRSTRLSFASLPCQAAKRRSKQRM